MTKKIIWVFLNSIAIILSIKFDNFLFVLISLLSIAFLYDSFLDSFMGFINHKVNIKTLQKDYVKYITYSPVTMGIFIKIFFGIHLTYSLLRSKEETLPRNKEYYLLLLIGAILIISMLRDIIAFNKENE